MGSKKSKMIKTKGRGRARDNGHPSAKPPTGPSAPPDVAFAVVDDNRNRDPLQLGCDLFTHAAAFLDVFDLVSASQVSKAWRDALCSSSGPWRAACAGTDADEADRFDTILPPPSGTPSAAHTWRTLALNYVRTENAWASGMARSSTHEIDFTLDNDMTLAVSSRAGVVFFTEGDDSGECLLVNRRNWKRIFDLPTAEYPVAGALQNHVLRWDEDDRGVQVLRMNRRGVSLTLDKVAEFTLDEAGSGYAPILGTRSGAEPCLVATIPDGLRVYAPPTWRPQDIRMQDAAHPQFVFLPSSRVYADMTDDVTQVYARTFSGAGEQLTQFPASDAEHAALAFNVRRCTVVASTPDPDMDHIELEGMMPGDKEFDEAATDVDPETDGPWFACFNDTDLGAVVQRHTLLILRNYADVFAAVIDIPEAERAAYIAARTIALRFGNGIWGTGGYGHRFAVATNDDLYILDTRNLPTMPLERAQNPRAHLRAKSGRRPQLRLHVFVSVIPQPFYSEVNIQLGVDSRAVYVIQSPAYEGAKWVMSVHAFDRPPPCPDLPAEVVLCIGGCLYPSDLVAANQVCRGWRDALGSSSAPWRASCTDTDADEADRFAAIPPAPAGVSPDLHKWRTLALNHRRTENAWRTGRVRTSTVPIKHTPTSTLSVSSRSGVLLLRAGTAPDPYGFQHRIFADRRKFDNVHDMNVVGYSSIESTHDVVVHSRDDGRAHVSNVVRRAGAVELDEVALLRPMNRPTLAVLGTRSGPVACLCEPIRTGQRVFAPPSWESVDIERAGRSGVGMDIKFVFLSSQMVAFTAMSTTAVYDLPSAGATKPRAKFPFGHQKCASLAFDFRLQHKSPGLHYAAAMVEGHEGFDEVVDSSEPATSTACINDTDMAVVVRGPKLLILRNYLDVFEAVVHLPEHERNAYIAARTIALGFDALPSEIAAHGHRFVVSCGPNLVVIDSRDLPAVPPPPGPYPSVLLDVLLLPYRSGLFAVDSRAVYVLDHHRIMTVHAFDR